MFVTEIKNLKLSEMDEQSVEVRLTHKTHSIKALHVFLINFSVITNVHTNTIITYSALETPKSSVFC